MNDPWAIIATYLVTAAIVGGWAARTYCYAVTAWSELSEAQRQRARAFWAAMARAGRTKSN